MTVAMRLSMICIVLAGCGETALDVHVRLIKDDCEERGLSIPKPLKSIYAVLVYANDPQKSRMQCSDSAAIPPASLADVEEILSKMSFHPIPETETWHLVVVGTPLGCYRYADQPLLCGQLERVNQPPDDLELRVKVNCVPSLADSERTERLKNVIKHCSGTSPGYAW